MLDQLLQQVSEHARKFNYKLSDTDKEELIALYEMNHDEYNSTMLSLHIENYVQRKSLYGDSAWMGKRRQSVSARQVHTKDLSLSTFDKSDEVSRFLLFSLGTEIPFSLLTNEQKSKLVASMYPLIVEEGTELIRQGDVGAEMYVIQSGEFDVLIDGQLTNKLHPGSKFGELALLHEIPRTATVKAASKSRVWAAEQTSFSCIRIQDQLYRKDLVRTALKNYKEMPCLSDNTQLLERAVSSALFKIHFPHQNIEIQNKDLLVVFKDAKIIMKGCDSQISVKKGDIIRSGFTTVSELECGIVPYHAIILEKDKNAI